MKNKMEHFEIGIHVSPPAEFINAYHYNLLKAAGITHIDHFLLTTQDNLKSLELLKDRNMKATCYTQRCEDFFDSNQAVLELAEIFGDEAVYGIYVKDEPSAKTHSRYAEIYKMLKQIHPEQLPYVNLFPDYASHNIQLGIENPMSVVESKEINRFRREYQQNQLQFEFPIRTPKSACRRLKTISLISEATLSCQSQKITMDFYEDESCLVHAGRCTKNQKESNRFQWVFDACLLLKSDADYFVCLNIATDQWRDFTLQGMQCSLVFEDVYTEYLESWINQADPEYLMVDFYPFTYAGEREDYFYCMEAIRNTALKYDVWCAGYIQSIGIKNALIRPNADQIRYHIYSMLAYGLKGLNWFTWWTPECGEDSPEIFDDGIIDRKGRKTNLYDIAKDMGKQITTLGGILITLTSQKVYHTGNSLPYAVKKPPHEYWLLPTNTDENLIISEFLDSSGQSYLMIVNKDYDNAKMISFHVGRELQYIGRINHSTLQETPCYMKQQDHYDPVFSLDFLPGEGQLLKISR